MLTRFETFMIAFVAIFLTGTLWPSLPHISLSFIAIFIAFPCLFARTFKPYITLSTPIAGALFGFSWVCLSANWYLNGQLGSDKIHQRVLIEAKVDSIIIEDASAEQIKFLLKVRKYGAIKEFLNPPKILVSWRSQNFQIKQGDIVKLFVSLKGTSGKANPHTFNYQQWLASRNIVATGNIINSPSNQVLRKDRSLRQVLLDKLLGEASINSSLFNGRWISALALGYREQLTQADWQLLQSTGTAHLFSISGMHLALVAAYSSVIGKYVLGFVLSFLGVKKTSMTLANLAFVCVSSGAYAFIAGMEVPVIRALVAVLVFSYLAVYERYWLIRTKFLFLVFVFCILFPYSILGVSFWFSFTAVFLILFYMWRFPASELYTFKDKCITFFKLQCFLSISTMPITLAIFGTLSTSAILANLILVPFVSLLLLPVTIILVFTLLLSLNIPSLFIFVDFLMQMVITLLDFFATHMPALQYAEQFSILWVVYCFSIGFLLLIPRWPFKRIIVICMAAFYLAYVSAIKPVLEKNNAASQRANDKVVFHIFDVGHGNSSLLRLGQTTILFDTGAGKANEFSNVEQIIKPYFRANKIKKLQHVFISHFDQDHAGGLFALHHHVAYERLHTPQKSCLSGSHWQVNSKANDASEKIQIKAIWPLSPNTGQQNNDSCVLIINTPHANILLTGDIEKSAEKHLLAPGALDALNIDILIAPHHGSRSSSSLKFVQKIRPKFVVFATSNPSRWGHPHQEVVSRYLNVGSEILHVGQLGAIEFDLSEPQIKLSTYRKHLYNRWYFKSWEAPEA